MAGTDELKVRGPRSPAWAWCLTVVVLAHAALLPLGSDLMRGWQRERLAPRPPGAPVALQVRRVPASAAAAQPQAAPAEVPAPAAREAASGPGPQSAPPAAPPPAEPPVYVPRALLSVAPVARAPVLLQWPANWPFRRSYTAVLRLYLDEGGRVVRVEPDGEDRLPGPLFDSAREAFLAATFTPGQVQGQAVRSWMRVEVSFEADLPSSPP